MGNVISPEAKEFIIQGLARGIPQQKISDLVMEKYGESITQQGVCAYKTRYKAHGARIEYLSKQWKARLASRMDKIALAQPDNIIRLLEGGLHHIAKKLEEKKKLTSSEHDLMIKTALATWKVSKETMPILGETSGQEHNTYNIIASLGHERVNRIIELAGRIGPELERLTEHGRRSENPENDTEGTEE